MKRENKAYSYKEQIIEMELQEVMPFALLVSFSGWSVLTVSGSAGAEEEERHQRGGAPDEQTEGDDASPAGTRGSHPQETPGGMEGSSARAG